MTNTVIPTPEEHAYYLGWTAHFAGQELKENPHDPETEISLFEKWQEGWESAEKSANALADL